MLGLPGTKEGAARLHTPVWIHRGSGARRCESLCTQPEPCILCTQPEPCALCTQPEPCALRAQPRTRRAPSRGPSGAQTLNPRLPCLPPIVLPAPPPALRPARTLRRSLNPVPCTPSLNPAACPAARAHPALQPPSRSMLAVPRRRTHVPWPAAPAVQRPRRRPCAPRRHPTPAAGRRRHALPCTARPAATSALVPP